MPWQHTWNTRVALAVRTCVWRGHGTHEQLGCRGLAQVAVRGEVRRAPRGNVARFGWMNGPYKTAHKLNCLTFTYLIRVMLAVQVA